MDRGGWRATVHRVTKGTRLSDKHQHIQVDFPSSIMQYMLVESEFTNMKKGTLAQDWDNCGFSQM